jgi:dihydrolipoamide dehydrogenase
MDVSKMMKNKEQAVKGLTGGIEGLFKKNKVYLSLPPILLSDRDFDLHFQVTYVKGFGKLSSPNSVSVDLLAGGSQVIDAKNIILAVGSEVTPLPTCPVDNAGEQM